jgi:nicotinate-nucleotide adenylyltransferase
VAIFGGTFNPPHAGHLAAARAAADACRLDRVLFIPAAAPPHKSVAVPYEHRYRMVELACAADPRFAPSRAEAGTERSYSIHTIEKLRREHPEDEFFFLIGADAFEEIQTWHRWRDVVRQVEFIVVSRPGHDYRVPGGAQVHRLDSVAVPVSSSEVREALARGECPREVPDAVLAYARAHRLYG